MKNTKDIIITVDEITSMIDKDKSVIGIQNENLQGNIIFQFKNTFIDGTAWLEIDNGDTQGYINLAKENETYKLPIYSSLLAKAGKIDMQLKITENANIKGIPIFKSKIFFLNVLKALNTTATIPEEYPTWIDIISEALNEIDNIDITANKIGKTATVTITDRYNVKKTVTINDGKDYTVAFEIDNNGNLIAFSNDVQNLSNYFIDENGCLILSIGGIE